MHKEKFALYYKNKKDEKENEAKKKRKTASALEAIEKAAKAAYHRDVHAIASQVGQTKNSFNTIHISDKDHEAVRLAALQPPPAPASTQITRKSTQKPRPKLNKNAKISDDLVVVKAKNAQQHWFIDNPFTGQYVEDGRVYVQAEPFEEILERNIACEAWNPTRKLWRKGKIVAISIVPMPEDKETIKQYTVSCEALSGAPQKVVVRVNALRLLPPLPPPANKKAEQRKAAMAKEVNNQAVTEKITANSTAGSSKIDENTGYSNWQTVTLTVAETQQRNDEREKLAISALGVAPKVGFCF